MKDFKKLLVWQKGIEIAEITFQFADSLPSEEKYGLRSQMTRAAVSVPSNIAEGSSRKSDKEYAHFLEISLGSSFQLETQFLIYGKHKIGNPELITKSLKEINELQKMLYSYYLKIN